MALTPVSKIPAYAVIIRAIHERGDTQLEALRELRDRGLWLTVAQMKASGIWDKDWYNMFSGHPVECICFNNGGIWDDNCPVCAKGLDSSQKI